MRPSPHAYTDPTVLIPLDSGRLIRLEGLMRERTYLHFPKAPLLRNTSELLQQAALVTARRKFYAHGEAGGPLMAPPVLLTGPWSKKPEQAGGLPRWVSYGLFSSDQPTPREPGIHHSQLIVVWYQDYAQPLLEGGFLHWLRGVDWDANDCNFKKP